MKRFRSPLQKIHRIQQQQLLLAELAVAHAQAELRRAEEEQRRCERQIQQAERFVSEQLKSPAGVRSAAVLSNRGHLVSCQQQLLRQRDVCVEKINNVRAAQSAYQDLKARLDGVAQILERRKTEHRRQALLTEQVRLDETAAGLRLQSGDSLFITE